MEIVHFDPNGNYERYEELTLKKDQYEKEADLYQKAYTREFGDLMTESFQLKIDCIALKKEIALYVKAKNQGKEITPEEVQEYLDKHMSGYYAELKDMIKKRDSSKKGSMISSYEEEQIKKTYRRLAKLLHPDISPLTADFPQLYELFRMVINAYKRNDLKDLRKLEVLINKELEDNGIEGFDVIVPDMEDRIEELERDINEIITSIPYVYKDLLDDREAVAEKKQDLNDEIEEYKKYKDELTVKLEEIKGGDING